MLGPQNTSIACANSLSHSCLHQTLRGELFREASHSFCIDLSKMELPTALLAFSFFSAVFAADGPTQGSPASPAAAAITAPPSGFELRKRQGDRHYVCGYDPSGESVTCPNHDLTCAASIYPDAEAYVYCSTGGALLATVTTTAFANWDTATRCPSLAYCW